MRLCPLGAPDQTTRYTFCIHIPVKRRLPHATIIDKIQYSSVYVRVVEVKLKEKVMGNIVSPSFKILKTWQGIVEIVLRVACTVSEILCEASKAFASARTQFCHYYT